MARRLSQSDRLRRIVLSALAKVDVDVSIRHQWTGDRISLHAFRHRGYWYHGRRRERDTMLAFAHLIQPADIVFDVGAHIGYTALYFARLAPKGAVHAFEPAPSNLTYLRHNVRALSNVVVVSAAVGELSGQAEMWVDSLSGQNSTLLPDLMSIPQTERHVHVPSQTTQITVPVMRLDDYADAVGLLPDFVKMDIEGFELQALTGAARVLRDARPMLMVEITRNAPSVEKLLTTVGYCAFDHMLRPLGQFSSKPRNTFFLHREVHQTLIEGLQG
jgi:FkbM family methyltransferase